LGEAPQLAGGYVTLSPPEAGEESPPITSKFIYFSFE
jgi:hypothetical protein